MLSCAKMVRQAETISRNHIAQSIFLKTVFPPNPISPNQIYPKCISQNCIYRHRENPSNTKCHLILKFFCTVFQVEMKGKPQKRLKLVASDIFCQKARRPQKCLVKSKLELSDCTTQCAK